MTEVEKKFEEHLEGFPARQKEMLERFDAISKQISVGLTHPEPAPKTIAMIGAMADDMAEVKKLNEEWKSEILSKFQELVDNNKRQNRVLFGDPEDKDDKGIQGMVKDIHTKISGEAGFWDRIFFIAKVAGSVTAIGFLITGIIAFVKKY